MECSGSTWEYGRSAQPRLSMADGLPRNPDCFTITNKLMMRMIGLDFPIVSTALSWCFPRPVLSFLNILFSMILYWIFTYLHLSRFSILKFNVKSIIWNLGRPTIVLFHFLFSLFSFLPFFPSSFSASGLPLSVGNKLSCWHFLFAFLPREIPWTPLQFTMEIPHFILTISNNI